MDNAGLMSVLDHHGIAVSAGSACSSQEDTPSHVLEAIGLSDRAAQETIRVSLGSDTSARDIRYTMRVLRAYVANPTAGVAMVTPAQLDEAFLFDEQTYILDVRPQSMCKRFQGLPNAHEASFISIEKYLPQIPRDKHILVVCQRGNLSYIVAHYLKSKGFERVSNLRSGVVGWKAQHGGLYQQYAGQNSVVLQPAG